jgi:hypothetical protein
MVHDLATVKSEAFADVPFVVALAWGIHENAGRGLRERAISNHR